RASTLSLEGLMALHPDLVVDCGNTDETWISQARQVSEQTQIPWLLLNGKLAQSAEQLTTLGKTLGEEHRAAEQAYLASRFVGEAQAFATSPAANLRFYAARGPRGLETGLKGSLHTEAAELLGLHNVAQIADRHGLTQVSMENLLRWQPDIILVQEAVTADFIRRDPLWQGVKAVAEQRILFLSGLPFGWLDAPPGINRLLGLRRLHAWLDPAINRQFKSDMQHYAQLFWHCSLSDADYQKLVAS
ncbi:ABC transporter substrate-binding protein, partial [Escherichia coli]|nr:ABC transporter substrate-binding protein [Escherichia coli]